MSEPIRYVFPMPPNLANARLHWRTKDRLHQQWKTRAILGERNLRGRRPRRPFERVRVTAIMFPRQPMDDDNAAARLKWPMDLLVERGVIVDDSKQYVVMTGYPEQRVGGKPSRIELLLEVLQ